MDSQHRICTNQLAPYGTNNGVIEMRQADNSTVAAQLYWYTTIAEVSDSYASVGQGGLAVAAMEKLGLAGDGINFASNIRVTARRFSGNDRWW